jgi:hypothetical protein
MVQTRSHLALEVQIGVAGTLNNQNAQFKEFKRHMAESMEALKILQPE